jgi:hypothetical protein
MLTIREKREFFARLVRARLSELPDDSNLRQEFRTTVDATTRKLLDKPRAISLDNELGPEARDQAPRDNAATVVVWIGSLAPTRDQSKEIAWGPPKYYALQT